MMRVQNLRISLTDDDMKKIITTEYRLEIPSTSYDGKINGYYTNDCKIELHHNTNEGFHAHVKPALQHPRKAQQL